MNSRVEMLLEALNLKERLLDYETENLVSNGAEIDFVDVKRRIEFLRKDSIDFLRRSIEY